jgi:hypothetical protein
MITEREILDAIDDLLREPVSITDCGKIASLMVVHDHLFDKSQQPRERDVPAAIIVTDENSDFLRAVNGRRTADVMAVMDELMEAVKVLQPRIYDEVMDRVRK